MNDDQATTSGTVTIGARTYDPVIGKFLTVDAVLAPLNPLQNNGYSYSANSPISASDPTGECYTSASGPLAAVLASGAYCGVGGVHQGDGSMLMPALHNVPMAASAPKNKAHNAPQLSVQQQLVFGSAATYELNKTAKDEAVEKQELAGLLVGVGVVLVVAGVACIVVTAGLCALEEGGAAIVISTGVGG